MRRIDFWVGQPGCLFLTCVRLVLRAFGREKHLTEPPKKILFFKLVEQGATVLAFGAIQRAIRMAGRDNVYFCVFDNNRPILDILDVVPEGNLLTIRQSRFSLFVLDSIRTLLTIRRIGIDAVIDMEFYARASAMFAYLTGAPRRVGFHSFCSDTPYRGNLMTHRLQYNPYLHWSVASGLLVETLEHDPGDVPMVKIPLREIHPPVPTFLPTYGEKERLRELVAGQSPGRPVKRIVLLNPNASDMLPIRKWPNPRFVELGRRLLDEHEDVTLVITGAPDEQDAADEMRDAIGDPRAISLAGKTTLRELVVLYTLSEVLVTNDSGPAHFASMTDVDIVVLFGPETPKLFGPLGNHVHIVSQKFACSPCISAFNHRFSPCTNNLCVQTITADQVYDVVRVCLASRRRATVFEGQQTVSADGGRRGDVTSGER